MSVKDLFNKRKNNKVVTKSKQEEIEKNVESSALIAEKIKEKKSFVSHVDYSKPENFARYGSAQSYYQDSIKRIYQTYPYDGSLLEKTKWNNESSGLDKWVVDNIYPKTVGHVKLGTGQSVYVKGGPNRDPSVAVDDKEELSKQYPHKEGNANIWDPEIYRTSNVHINGTLGNTIEFWAKLDASISGNVYPVVAGNEVGNRIQIAYNATSSILGLTYTDDTTTGLSGANGRVTLSGFLGTTWAHYAFSFINSGTDVQAEVYKNGTRVALLTASGTNVGSISQAQTFLNINGTASGTDTANGLYVDEFRFWKQRRTEEQIGRHWFTNVNGGTNTDNEKYNKENNKIDLGVYFKFNEGVTGNESIDSIVLDYSGRISNGTISGYDLNVRKLTSALDEYGLFDDLETKDPIVYSSHPLVASVLSSYETLGQAHDYINNSSIFNTLPAWIIEEDEETGNDLKKFTQVLSSYFDEAHQQIKELTQVGEVKYYSLKEENDKPYSLIRNSLESRGIIVPDLFSEANAIEEILSRGEQDLFNEKIHDIKNTIYQNIYNNISFIFKSKGTEKSFRNLIRCFGIDDELVKINLYADNSDYTLEDTRRTTAIKKNFVDFNSLTRDSATVYCQNDVARTETSSYIDAPSNANSNLISFTVETEVIIPKKADNGHPAFTTPIQSEEQILVLAEADSTQTGDSVYQNSNPPIIDIYIEKEQDYSENVKFAASITIGGVSHLLKSDVYKSVYDNSKWNLAVKLSPVKELGDKILGGATTDYELEFYGVSMLADSVEHEFTKTQVITSSAARALVEKKKFISIGASKQNYDPSNSNVNRKTNLKISSTLFWYDYLSNEEIKAHSSDGSNFGRLHPNDDAYSFVANLSSGGTADIRVPRKDTLAMHWDFNNVTKSDGSGTFVVEDLSEGYEASDSRYGWFTELVRKQVTGRGRHFQANDNQVTNKEFIYSAKHRTPEIINSEDLVEIRVQDDDKFTRDSRPITHFFAAEKSMYQIINDEIVNLFATIVEFNDLIGQPINRYRMEYKSLEKFRQMFFERVKNVPSLEKYVDYYKWIDNSIGMMLEQLIPVSSNFSSELRTMIESHVLERNKYWTKFPTLEMEDQPIEANVRGINEMLYNYDLGRAPLAGEDKCLWDRERAERGGSTVTSGDANVDADRETIRDITTREIKGQTKLKDRDGDGNFIEESDPTLYDSSSTTFYEGRVYATRRLSKPYKLNIAKSPTIHGGVNYSETTKDPNDFVRASTPMGKRLEVTSLDINPRECSRESQLNTEVFKKFKRSSTVTLKEGSDSKSLDGSFIYPRFGQTLDAASADLTNLHNDSYGDDAEVPMQGPFTSQWVGGNQHRHVDLSTYYGADTGRPELFLRVGDELKNPKDVSINNASARLLRDEVAKRPLNIKNIKTIRALRDRSTSNEKPLGNYTHDYDVVQTSGRSNNNRWFVKDEGNQVINRIASSVITGLSDYALPDRTKANSVDFGRTENIFVERFSAPGDPLTMGLGFMDHEAAEFSPYNSINFRNFSVRSHVHYWLAQHSGLYEGSQGYRQDLAPGIAAYQKNNRNRLYDVRLVDSGPSESYVCKSTFDNAYVRHQIPRSDLQYHFATSSIDIRAYASESFDRCGAEYPLLLSGYYESLILSERCNPLSPGCGDPAAGNRDPYFRESYADYQGSGWRLIRGSERNEPVESRKENIISVIDGDEQSSSNYREPVAAWNKPMAHRILRNSRDLQIAIDFEMEESTPPTILARHAYSNGLEFFANPNLAARVEVVKNSNHFYDEINNLLSGNFPLEQTPYYTSFLYKEIIFPKHRNVGLNKVRERSKFDGYDEFWDSVLLDRMTPTWQKTKLGFDKNILPSTIGNGRIHYSSFVMDYYRYKQNDGTTDEFFDVVGDLNYAGTRAYRSHIFNKIVITQGLERTREVGQDKLFDPEVPMVPHYNTKVLRDDYAPTPMAQLFYLPETSVNQEYYWFPRKVIDQSGLVPTYDDYDHYGEELRSIGQNYGILSEFRISQHMDKYLLQGGGNFREKNYSFLSLDGASYDSNRHKGNTHTQFSSKKDITKTRTYSTNFFKGQDAESIPDSRKVSKYPTSLREGLESTKITNNNKFNGSINPGNNPIYAGGTFTIDNSVNTNVVISGPIPFVDVERIPVQTGINAAAEFNINNENDYLVAEFNRVIYRRPADGSIVDSNVFPLDDGVPLSVSVWAQPNPDRETGGFLCLEGLTIGQNKCSISILEKTNIKEIKPEYADSFGNSGLTVIFHKTTDFSEKAEGIATNRETDVITFFHANKTPAFLSENKFNHVVFQMVAGLKTSNSSSLIKLWLNGQELFGAHPFALSNQATHKTNVYSPASVLRQDATVQPHGVDLGDTTVSPINFAINKIILGNSHPTVAHESVQTEETKKFRFSGLLDELSVWSGFITSKSIERLYNNGLPNNLLNELEGNAFAQPVTGDIDAWKLSSTIVGRFVELDATGSAITDPVTTFGWTLIQMQRAITDGALSELHCQMWHRIGVAHHEEITECESWDDEFFNSYVHSDNIKFIEKITSDQNSLGVKVDERVRLKVNAIKKLLPYDGFYPQDRTVQIAKLFAEKAQKSIKPQPNDAVFHNEQAVQAALQHFFAPGILYNSIKAGIACDWASFTDSSGLEQSAPNDSYAIESQNIERVFKTPAPHWYCPRQNRENLEEALFALNQTDDQGPIYSMLKAHQPGFTDVETTAPDGFITVTEPTTRLPFESLLNPTKFLSMTTPEAKDGFRNISLELNGWNCEGTILTFKTVEVNSDGDFYRKINRISIGTSKRPGFADTDWDVDVEQFLFAPDRYGAASIPLDGSEESSISLGQEISIDKLNEIIAVKLCRAINERDDFSVIAVPGWTPNHQYDAETSEPITYWFPTIKPELFGINYAATRLATDDNALSEPLKDFEWDSSDEVIGKQSNGTWVIRLISTGPLENTIRSFMPNDPSASTYERARFDNDSSLTWKQFHCVSDLDEEVQPWRKKITEKLTHYSAKSLPITTRLINESRQNYDSLEATLVTSRRITSGIRTGEAAITGGVVAIIGSQNYSTPNSLGIKPFFTSDGDPAGTRVTTAGELYNAELDTGATQEEQFRSNSLSDPSSGRFIFTDAYRYENDSEESYVNKFFLMTPEYYRPVTDKGTSNGLEGIENYVYPSFEWLPDSASDVRYENAINNFVAEVPRFFLQNRSLTTLTSKPEIEFKQMTEGVTYYMDVAISKSEDFEIARTSDGEVPSKYFGPAMKWKELRHYDDGEELSGPASQAAYVPPYLYGKGVTRLSFTARESKVHTLNEILSRLTMEDFSREHHEYFRNKSLVTEDITTIDPITNQSKTESVQVLSNFRNQPAWKSRMKVESCLELFGKRRVKQVTYDLSSSKLEEGGVGRQRPLTAQDASDSSYNAWCISTKFECPVLNFSQPQILKGSTSDHGEVRKIEEFTYSSSYDLGTAARQSGQGIWSSYGKIPQNGQGIFIALEESFTSVTEGERIGSLIDVCGFKSLKQQVGQIAEERTISEAVVMIPFVDSPLSEGTIKVDDRNFFAITPEKFVKQVSNVENGLPAVAAQDYGIESDIEETTITRMSKMMKKYNLPPRYDFMKFSSDSKPFVIYFFEFEQSLDKEDLSNIWQGLQPKIALTATKDSNEVIHDLAPWEFFEGRSVTQDIRWMVFKVKKTASMDYEELLNDSQQDQRFNLKSASPSKSSTYSYNYPYDYFSLIEMVKIEAGIEFEINPMELYKKKSSEEAE